MQPRAAWALLTIAAIPTTVGARNLRRAGDAERTLDAVSTGDHTAGKVVELLQKMLDDSKAEDGTEGDLFDKFKAYCDDNTDEKTKSVETLTEQIGLLENKNQELRSSNGKLSLEVADLQAAMDENQATRDKADGLRTTENTAFVKEEGELNAAIGQLKLAMDALKAIAADQTAEDAGDHSQFMAGFEGSMLHLKSSVKKALLAADAFLTPDQRWKALQFLQDPWTGHYTPVSGEVFGILKSMMQTFEANLKSATDTEAAAVTAHQKFMGTKNSEHTTMKTSFDAKQAKLGTNDDDLSTKTTELESAQQQLSDDKDFLANLEPMCKDKTQEYETRRGFRKNEQAAIYKAISILDNDVAFKKFDAVAATSTGATGFIQLSSRHRSIRGQMTRQPAKDVRRSSSALAEELLQRASRVGHSKRLLKVAGMLTAGNPFEKVLFSIKEMKQLIDDEEKVDKEQFDWCADETGENQKNLDAKTTQEGELNSAIDTLVESVDNPETGLKVLIKNTEESIAANAKSQSDETDIRRTENLAYQKAASNCAEAEAILQKAVAILENFYAELEKRQDEELNSFLQADPEPPETWTGKFEGQKAGGKEVIKMLESVMAETRKVDANAHTAEQQAQIAYEDSMKALTTEKADLQVALLKHQKGLADAEENLVGRRADLDKTKREMIAVQRYMDQIKPGCDFITTNYDTRKTNRGKEKAALDNAVTLLEGSPAFTAAKLAAKHKAWGSCEETCTVDETHVDCKACLAGVSIPGYCVGHGDTPGC